jgi:hypothetical protein
MAVWCIYREVSPGRNHDLRLYMNRQNIKYAPPLSVGGKGEDRIEYVPILQWT